MLKTPNEIKRGLETCARDEDCRCCPYYTEVYGASCITHCCRDALSYIEMLEKDGKMTQ